MKAMDRSKTVALRKGVSGVISRIIPSVYFGQADGNHPKQYVVYDLEELSFEDGCHRMQLEVNCMDYGTDTAACETLADQIQAEFDHYKELNDEILFKCYFDRRQPVYEEDRKIIRRRLLFEIHLYERS